LVGCGRGCAGAAAECCPFPLRPAPLLIWAVWQVIALLELALGQQVLRLDD